MNAEVTVLAQAEAQLTLERREQTIMAGDEKNNGALVTLTEKIVENGSKVSGAVTLMSENLMELADAEKRTEDKTDKLRKELRVSHKQTIEEFTKQIKVLNDFISEIRETGIVSFIKTAKRLMFALIVSAIGGITWLVLNGVLKLYIEVMLKSKGLSQ